MFVSENMVKEYLEKLREEFLVKRTDLKEEINSYENKLKENIQFVQVLSDTNDPSYEAFTPREVNSFNRKKISELQEEQKNLTEKVTELRNQLGETDFKIAEINSVIKVAKEDVSNASDIALDEMDQNMKMTLLQSIETERQRIARDLHDTTAQSLTSLVHKTELCTKLLEVDPVRCKLELFSVNKTFRDVIEETRRLIYDLRPMSFDDIGFNVTVERSLDKINRLNNIKCIFHEEGEPYPLNNVIQLSLIRIIQESCNNAVKHAAASRLDVTLKYEENEIILIVADDGKGFDVSTIPDTSREDNSGFGMAMMRERVYLLSGKLDVKSSPGNGCEIIVTIPISKEGV